MRAFKKFLIASGLVVGGIYLYATDQPHDFDQVQIGSTKASVLAKMGDPQEASGPGFYNENVEEMLYYRWPIPMVYSIEISDEKVVRKRVYPSP